MGILTVPGLYFLALVSSVKKNPHLFLTNREGYANNMNITTRARDDLRTPLHVSSFYEKGPLYRAMKAFQILPPEIRSIEGVERFRKAACLFVKKRCFYSFDFSLYVGT